MPHDSVLLRAMARLLRRLDATGGVGRSLKALFPAPPDDAEPVIVVHGLGRTPASMAVLEARLEASGFRVISFGYPSRSEPIEELAQRLGAAVKERCPNEVGKVHFVTHSMGGVIVRAHLAGQPEPHRGRVVMLAPPSQGSEIIDAFTDSPLMQRLLGPAAVQLGTDPSGIASRLGAVRFDLGIIAGDRSLNPLGSWLISGPDDGKVGVNRAHIDGAADFKIVSASHTFIMNRGDVADDVISFLRDGEFR